MEQRYLVGAIKRFVSLMGTDFYTYYQISRADESDELETEPKKEGELKSRYEGPIALSVLCGRLPVPPAGAWTIY